MKFLVISNAPILKKDYYYVAYAPYVNEINIWFKNVTKVGIVSPTFYPEEFLCKRIDQQKIKIFDIPFINFSSFFQILQSLCLLPKIFYKLFKSFLWADHIHFRCPGNIGLLGCLVQIFFPHTIKTCKYAGNWDPMAQQPWSYKLQKKILSSPVLTKNMTVLVYGEWPGQSKNILPFFTASFSEKERQTVLKDDFNPLRLLFVGSLVLGKNPKFAIQLVEELILQKIPAVLDIYGDGKLGGELREEFQDKKYICFKGNQSLDVVKQAYRESHFLILPSKSEGWPKAVAEAMFFGCIPIATAVSCVPWMLGAPPAPEGGAKETAHGKRGVLIPDLDKRDKVKIELTRIDGSGRRNVESPDVFKGVDGETVLRNTVERIMNLLKNPEEMRRMSLEAQEWSQEYTLEKFEEAIKKVLKV